MGFDGDALKTASTTATVGPVATGVPPPPWAAVDKTTGSPGREQDEPQVHAIATNSIESESIPRSPWQKYADPRSDRIW